jgi:hypothetical protein
VSRQPASWTARSIAQRVPLICALGWVMLPFAFVPRSVAQEKSGVPELPEAAAKKSKGTVAHSAESPGDVVIIGQLGREAAGPHDQFRFWITVENRSGSDLTDLQIEHLDVPGFSIARRCWSADRADPACWTDGESHPAAPLACQASGSAAGQRDTLCATLAAKHAVTVWGVLAPGKDSARGSAFAVLTWTADQKQSEQSVSLGNVESESGFRHFWVSLTERWIALPIWITIFGALYALWSSYREGKKHERELELQAVASKRATESEQQRHTWNVLLLKVHRLAFQHYLPIASTVQGILLYFSREARAEGESEDNFLGAFCYMLRFHWRVRKMKRAGASWYFKKLTAEELVVVLFQTHRNHMGLQDLGRQAVLDRLLDWFKDDTTVADVLEYLESCSREEWEFWLDFRSQAKKWYREESLLLSAMITVMTFEINRVYYYWYEERRPISLDKDELKVLRAAVAAAATQSPELPEQVEEYLKEAFEEKKLERDEASAA